MSQWVYGLYVGAAVVRVQARASFLVFGISEYTISLVCIGALLRVREYSLSDSVLEVGMLKGLLGRNSASRLILEHLLEQVKTLVIYLLWADELPQIVAVVIGPLNFAEVGVL